MPYQLWQHERSGEVYAVETDYRTILAATGPLEARQYAAALKGDWDGDADVLAMLRQANTTEYRLMDLRWRKP